MLPVFVSQLFGWPFLTFVLLLALIIIFRQGEIAVQWGRTKIKLRQISDNLDKELDPIRDEVSALQADVTALKAALSSRDTPRIVPVAGDGLRGDQLEMAHKKMMEALRSGTNTWRSIERLAAIGSVSESQALTILMEDKAVSVSWGKSGRRIARLRPSESPPPGDIANQTDSE